MKYHQALRTAAVESVLCIADRKAWRTLAAGLYGLLFIALRIVMLVTFPVSVPLIAWLIQHDSHRRLEQAQLARAQLIAGIHQNGRA